VELDEVDVELDEVEELEDPEELDEVEPPSPDPLLLEPDEVEPPEPLEPELVPAPSPDPLLLPGSPPSPGPTRRASAPVIMLQPTRTHSATRPATFPVPGLARRFLINITTDP
jgi:hypothetical protein